MQRVLIAIGAAAVMGAALLAFFLLGGDESETERLADTTPAAPAAESTSPDSTSPAPPAPPAAEAAGDSVADSERPVVQVKPRSPDPNSTEAASAPADAPQDEAPSFDVVRIEKSGETVIAGRAAPESEVTVSTEDGTAIGTARADASGSWAIVAEKPLAPGSHEIGIAAQGAEGETRLSDEVVVVVVPEPSAAAPGPAAPQPVPPRSAAPQAAAPQAAASTAAAQPQQQVLAVLTPRDGGASKVLPQEEEGIAQGDLVLDSVDYDEKGQAVIGGRAAPGSRMLLYLNNKLVGDTVAGPEGRWSHAPEEPVSEGLHDLRVDQVDGGGDVTARVETPFSREPVRVAAAGEEFVIVQPGNSLWRIARRTYGRGLQYSVIYQANREQIRDPDLIYPGQVFEIPKVN